MKHASWWVLAAAGGLLLLSPSVRAQTSTVEVLARVKQAMGGNAWDSLRTTHVHIKIKTGGLDGTGESWSDLRTGRSRSRYELGPIRGEDGFDGATVWSKDRSGQTRPEQGGDEREGAADEAYRTCMGYWFPDRWPAKVEPAGEKREGARTFQVLRITPERGRPFEMWIDAKTWLIDRTVEKAAMETRTTFLSDYGEAKGVKVPFEQRSTNGEERYDQFVSIESIEFDVPVEDSFFAMPASAPPDFAFGSGITSTVVPFELINNHIYVDVRLNGRGPFRLLCDTGGANVVTPTLAKELGLEAQGALQGRGVGEKSEDVGFVTVDTLQIGDVGIAKQLFAVFPLESFSNIEGVPQYGLVGYEIFKRFAVRVDYENRLLTLTDPAAFTYEGKGTVVPFQFNGHIPQVEGSVDGVPGKFDIDTGSRSSLSLLGPFVERNGFEAKLRPKFSCVTGWGVGGAARGRVARAGTLKLGDVTIESPVTELSLQKKGAFTDPYVAGNVGAGVLKRFNVVFDYRNQRIVFEPNANAAKPDVFDRSGMWVNLAGDAFEVVDVTAGAAAEKAGLEVGDRIVAVDGKAASKMTLPELRARFRADPPGTTIPLTVERKGKKLKLKLVLQDLV